MQNKKHLGLQNTVQMFSVLLTVLTDVASVL